MITIYYVLPATKEKLFEYHLNGLSNPSLWYTTKKGGINEPRVVQSDRNVIILWRSINNSFLKALKMIYWSNEPETDLVAAKTNTPVKTSTPSNSVRNCKKGGYNNKSKVNSRKENKWTSKETLTWLTTRSVTPVLSCPLFGAIESNSSKKSRHGAAAAALENISRTYKPTYRHQLHKTRYTLWLT